MRWYKDRPWVAERPIAETFEYYRKIASYQSRYPTYYGRVQIIDESNEILNTREFLNLNLDIHRNHISIEVEYQIDKPNRISFKITDNNFTQRIQGGLTFTPQEIYINKEQREGTAVSGTISALEVISLPPGSKNSSEYERMLVYLGQRDAEFLEGRVSGYQVGQKCTECGKGKLQFSGRKERTRIDKEPPLVEQENVIEVLECDSCGESFTYYQTNLK